MIADILEYTDEYEMLPKDSSGTVLLCVSGGADSMCLFEVMRHISYQRGFSIAVAHYNHMLRGAESDRDETFVMDICEAHNIPFYSSGSDIAKFAKMNSIGIEEAARMIRYEFFHDTAEKIGAGYIATAHTMNDNAETVIMNLIRGAGTNGISGIPPVRGKIIRPLLRTSRQEILNFLKKRNVTYVHDSSNESDLYTRNKIRHNIIPVFEQINPRINEALTQASEIMREDEEFISEIADLFINDCCAGATTNAKDLAVLPFSVSSRVIRKFYTPGNLSYGHVKDVLDLCRSDNPSAGLNLPGMYVYREYERVIFSPDPVPDDTQFATVYPSPGCNVIILGLGLNISCELITYDEEHYKKKTGKVKSNINKPFTTFIFKSVDICGKISVRPRREGDSIKLIGSNGTKTLKKLFIEKRIPVRQRASIPVICDDEGVLGIYGIGASVRAMPAQGDEALLITFKEITA